MAPAGGRNLAAGESVAGGAGLDDVGAVSDAVDDGVGEPLGGEGVETFPERGVLGGGHGGGGYQSRGGGDGSRAGPTAGAPRRTPGAVGEGPQGGGPYANALMAAGLLRPRTRTGAGQVSYLSCQPGRSPGSTSGFLAAATRFPRSVCRRMRSEPMATRLKRYRWGGANAYGYPHHIVPITQSGR